MPDQRWRTDGFRTGLFNTVKYTNRFAQFVFHRIAVKTQRPLNALACDLLRDVRNVRFSGDDRQSSFLFQRFSVVVLRFNRVLLHDSFFLFCISQTNGRCRSVVF